jgi:hypothetical protein
MKRFHLWGDNGSDSILAGEGVLFHDLTLAVHWALGAHAIYADQAEFEEHNRHLRIEWVDTDEVRAAAAYAPDAADWMLSKDQQTRLEVARLLAQHGNHWNTAGLATDIVKLADAILYGVADPQRSTAKPQFPSMP